MSFVFNKGVI